MPAHRRRELHFIGTGPSWVWQWQGRSVVSGPHAWLLLNDAALSLKGRGWAASTTALEVFAGTNFHTRQDAIGDFGLVFAKDILCRFDSGLTKV